MRAAEFDGGASGLPDLADPHCPPALAQSPFSYQNHQTGKPSSECFLGFKSTIKTVDGRAVYTHVPYSFASMTGI